MRRVNLARDRYGHGQKGARIMRRRHLVLFIAGAVLVSSLATWTAAAQIRSPAEVAARTAPPAQSRPRVVRRSAPCAACERVPSRDP